MKIEAFRVREGEELVVFSVEEFERVVAMFAEELLVALFVVAVFVDRGATFRAFRS